MLMMIPLVWSLTLAIPLGTFIYVLHLPTGCLGCSQPTASD